MNVHCRAAALLLVFAACVSHVASAEPYLAVQQGYKCVQCHVNPTGGSLRNDFGAVFSQNVMAARPLPEGVPAWGGKLGDFVRLGGDLREGWTRTDIPNREVTEDWELGELRLYGAVDVIRDRLSLVLDESLAQDDAQVRQAYVQWSNVEGGWYVKGGRFYLPFGWRLQDNGTFVRQVSGINMTGGSDYEGVEVGLETEQWSAQLALTNAAFSQDTAAEEGDQLTGQAVWVRPRGRLGVAAAFADADAGDRTLAGVFGGLRTGPVAWLGEVDYVRDESFADGTRTLVAALAEADWAVTKGHNLKLTGEWFEPDSDLDDDDQTRWSVVYEYTPIAFVQLRTGGRFFDGNPQNDIENREVWFLELHGFF